MKKEGEGPVEVQKKDHVAIVSCAAINPVVDERASKA